MARRKKKTAKKKVTKSASKGSKRGRKPIFTDEQRRVLDRMIKDALREQLRAIIKGM